MKLYVPGIKTFILGRYGSLLVILVFLIISQPFVETAIGRVLIELMFIAALVAGLRAIDIKRGFFRFELCLLIASIVCGAAGTLLDNTVLFGLGLTGESLFLFLVAVTILYDLFHSKKVTRDTLAGAVCVYLLIGLIWSYLYLLTEICVPGSFTFTQGDARMQLWVSKEFYSFFYFSLVTMTTVGYGDMSPVSTVARTFATMEGILGQVYLTILVARLVGMQLMDQQKEDG